MTPEDRYKQLMRAINPGGMISTRPSWMTEFTFRPDDWKENVRCLEKLWEMNVDLPLPEPLEAEAAPAPTVQRAGALLRLVPAPEPEPERDPEPEVAKVEEPPGELLGLTYSGKPIQWFDDLLRRHAIMPWMTSAEVAVGCCLWNHAGPKLRCYLKHETIAAETRREPKTVKAALKRLRDHGMISWRREGQRAPNTYSLHTPDRWLK